MLLPNRHGNSGDYRYGFNGMESDDEIKGARKSYDFGSRNIYDPRVMRFFSTDPDDVKYPDFSPYLFAANNPIRFIDIDGRGPIVPKSWWQGDPGKAFFAGIADGSWEAGTNAWEMVVEAFWYTQNQEVWEERYGEIRRTQLKLVHKLFNDEDLRNRILIEIVEKTGDYIYDLSGANGDDIAEYEKGKLVFAGLSAIIGAGELNALIKTGKFSANALRKIAKYGKFNPKIKRLPQDVKLGIGKKSPPAKPTRGRTVGGNANQNVDVQKRVSDLKQKGATDIRIDQQQVNVNGEHVGINRPDLQYTLDGQRYNVEWDTPSSGRGLGHKSRIKANDPEANVELIIMK
jgi:RHS repeat-associated protein